MDDPIAAVSAVPSRGPEKRRPLRCHSGLESREETPKEGICGRSYRTAATYVCGAPKASDFGVHPDDLVRNVGFALGLDR